MSVIEAIKEGNIEELKRLKEEGKSFDILIEDDQCSLIHLAIERGVHELLKFLLDDTNAINMINFPKPLMKTTTYISLIVTNITPVLYCSILNKFDLMKLLISRGADYLLQTGENYTPLHFACTNQNFEMIQHLLELSPPVNINTLATHFNISSLFLLFSRKSSDKSIYYKITKYLIEKGVDTKSTKISEITSITSTIGIAIKRNCEAAKLLIEKWDLKEEGDQIHSETLMNACTYNNMEIIRLLIEKGVNPIIPSIPHFSSDYSYTPLIIACTYGTLDDVIFLMNEYEKRKLDIKSIDYQRYLEGRTTLFYFASSSLNKVKYFVQAGMCYINDPMERNNLTKFPLLVAIQSKDINNIEYLLNLGYKKYINAGRDETPFSFACKHKLYDIARLLFEYGADPFIRVHIHKLYIHDENIYANIETLSFLLDLLGDKIEEYIDPLRRVFITLCLWGNLPAVRVFKQNKFVKFEVPESITTPRMLAVYGCSFSENTWVARFILNIVNNSDDTDDDDFDVSDEIESTDDTDDDDNSDKNENNTNNNDNIDNNNVEDNSNSSNNNNNNNNNNIK